MPVVTRLVTGCARIRLTAVTLQGLPVLTAPEGTAPLPEVVAARAEVTATVADLESWFEAFAGSMGRRQADAALVVPGGEPLPIELDAAWDAVRRAGRRDGVLVVLRLLWVEQRLDDLRALRQDLAGTGASLTG